MEHISPPILELLLPAREKVVGTWNKVKRGDRRPEQRGVAGS
jgi:hypothetical protein